MFKEFMAQKLPFLQMSKKNGKNVPAQPEEETAIAEAGVAEPAIEEPALPEIPDAPAVGPAAFGKPEEISGEPDFLRAEDDFEAGMSACREKKYAEAMVPLLRAAGAGHKEAQFLCGQLFQRGLAADADSRQALTWYKRSAKQGYLHAQLACAAMYEEGAGTSVNIKRALYWYEQAAKQGSVEAQLKCGRMYYCGRAETRNPKKARTWLETAAGQGSEDAKRLLTEYF